MKIKLNKDFFILTLFFILLSIFFYQKSVLVNFWYHLDPWVNKPIVDLLLHNLDWEKYIMYTGLGLRLYYILLAIFNSITLIDVFYITKYGFVFVSIIQILLFYLFFRNYFKNKNVGFLIIGLIILLSNSFLFRRLSITVRENISVIGLLGYLIIYLKYKFDKKILLGLTSSLVYGSNPITSVLLIGTNLTYALTLILRKNKHLFIEWLKQFMLGITLGGYFFYKIIDSLFWQYKYAETEVVGKNPYQYDFYYINFKHLSYIFVILIVISLIYYVKKIYKSKEDFINFNKIIEIKLFIFSFVFVVGFIYFAAFFPKIGLYQDRLIMYIGLIGTVPIIYFLIKYKKSLISLLLIMIIGLLNIIDNMKFEYTSPYDNTDLTKDYYKLINKYEGTLLTFYFDEHVINYVKSINNLDKELSEEFLEIDNIDDFNLFNTNNKYLLFIANTTFKDNNLGENFGVKQLIETGKLKSIGDLNYIYINN